MVELLVNCELIVGIQLWFIFKQQNDIANTLKRLRKLDATEVTLKSCVEKGFNNSLKANRTSTL